MGIIFSTDLSKMIQKIINLKSKTLRICVTQWERRALTPLGKIRLIKVLMIPVGLSAIIIISDQDILIFFSFNRLIMSFP